MVSQDRESSGAPILEGQVALVTGCARGIGLAIASTLARAGADVGLLDVLPLDAAIEVVRSHGRQAWPLKVDLTDRPAVREIVSRFIEERSRLDILINNAGVTSETSLQELSDKEFDQVMAVNASAMLATVQAAWPTMVRQGRGRIVLTGSRTAQAPSTAGPAYVASKGAVHSLVISFATAGGPFNILCNGVAPAAVDTENSRRYPAPNLPLGHKGTTNDVAEAVLFLASPMNNYINGVVLKINGGLLMG